MNHNISSLHYSLESIDNLTQLLQVTQEIAAETGMQDWTIEYHGSRMRYNWQDAKAVISGAKSEEWYVEKNCCKDCL